MNVNFQELLAIATLASLFTAAIIKGSDWIFKARESDQNLRKTIDLLAVNLEHNNKLFERDITQIRNDISELRNQHNQSATRLGTRISGTKTILLKFVNHFNTDVIQEIAPGKKLGLKFVDLKGDEEN